MDPRDRRPRQGRAIRRHYARKRARLRGGRCRLCLVRCDYAFGPCDGHQLPAGPRMMDLEILRRQFPDREIQYHPTIDSTMRAAAILPHGSVVLADRQTAGQGRHGHVWHSEPANGLYCSIVLKPTPVLTLGLGLATVEAIAQSCGIVCDLRWPNDVMLDGRKVAVILVQLTG